MALLAEGEVDDWLIFVIDVDGDWDFDDAFLLYIDWYFLNNSLYFFDFILVERAYDLLISLNLHSKMLQFRKLLAIFASEELQVAVLEAQLSHHSLQLLTFRLQFVSCLSLTRLQLIYTFLKLRDAKL